MRQLVRHGPACIWEGGGEGVRESVGVIVCESGLCCEGIDAPSCLHCTVKLFDQGGELCCSLGTKGSNQRSTDLRVFGRGGGSGGAGRGGACVSECVGVRVVV
jgi:hypothetical protein